MEDTGAEVDGWVEHNRFGSWRGRCVRVLGRWVGGCVNNFETPRENQGETPILNVCLLHKQTFDIGVPFIVPTTTLHQTVEHIQSLRGSLPLAYSLSTP